MNITEYKNFCEEFFNKEIFSSNENLKSEIGHLAPLEFQEWIRSIETAYSVKYEFISDMLKNIRNKYKFDHNSDNVIWENDPIKKAKYKNIINSYKNIYFDTINSRFKDFSIYNEKVQELKSFNEQRAYEESLKIKVGEKEFVAEQIIDVLWSGWECDAKAWLVNDNGEKKIVVTDHGTPYFAEPNFLEEKIKLYQKTIEDTQNMLSNFNKNKNYSPKI